MQNALERFRIKSGLSYAEMGRRVGYNRSTTMNHCKGEQPISDGAALRYHLRLQIPIEDLRPDLCPLPLPD